MPNLQRLNRQLESFESWEGAVREVRDESASEMKVLVAPVQQATRDRLLAAMQLLYLRAMERYARSTEGGEHPGRGLIAFPDPHALSMCLRSHLDSTAGEVNLLARSSLNINETILDGRSRASSALLALAAIGHGALLLPVKAMREVGIGIIESCMVSVSNLEAIDLFADVDWTLLHAVTILVSSSIWSGDRWLMDKGRNQQKIYCSTFKTLVGQLRSDNVGEQGRTLEETWTEWIQEETRRRYATTATHNEECYTDVCQESYTRG